MNTTTDQTGALLGFLTTGEPVYGTRERDGSPAVVSVSTSEGHFITDESGGFAGTWAGKDLAFTAEEIAALRVLFAGDLFDVLGDCSKTWAKS